MLREAEVEEIRQGLDEGLHGPILRKWCRQLLEDHDDRVRLERDGRRRGDQPRRSPSRQGPF